ncbi:hypothetical protein E4H04_11945 [Candidatus Bathyarchaeota archaeon]|nr:MAG: hypothetical protein E4H04_11945 [Candidatus Bathyarchaeota archaeon]
MTKDVLNSPKDTAALFYFQLVEKIVEIGHQEAFKTLGDSVLNVRVLEKYVKDDKVMPKDLASFIKEKFGANNRLRHCASRLSRRIRFLEEFYSKKYPRSSLKLLNEQSIHLRMRGGVHKKYVSLYIIMA